MHSSIKEIGLFHDLIQLLQIDTLQKIPNVEQLNQWASTLSPGFIELGLKFVAQDEHFDWQEQYYEEVIYNRSLIPTRIEHWHDFFNACIWLVFPKTKQLLNRIHIEEIALHGLKKRSKCRDAVTLFDECGVVMAICESQIQGSLRSHQWHQNFWLDRHQWGKDRQGFIFGHANYEMGLSPFIGLTGKAFFIDVPVDFFNQALATQYEIMDTLLLKQIGVDKQLTNNKCLSPLPLLGVPTWYADNQNENFYANTNYFRPKREFKK